MIVDCNADGMHVCFGLVVTDFVRRLIVGKKDNELRKTFGFFEEMARSENADIQDILQFSVLERLMTGDKEILEGIGKYMGLETKKLANHACTYFDVKAIG